MTAILHPAGTTAERTGMVRPARLAIAGFLAVCLVGVLLRPALPVDETRYLAVAWEMHLTGDWLVPTRNFAPYADKPPLLFWAINLVWSLTGVNETAARMVAPGFAALAMWLTGRLAARLWPDRAGVGPRAILALAGMPVFVFMGGLTMFDAVLTVAVLAGLLALILAGNGGRAGWIYWGAAIAFGVLAKGPVVLLHLVPAAVLLPAWHPAAPRWTSAVRGLALGLGIGLGLVLLWLIPAAIAGGPEYRRAILWTQSAGRMADSFAHARPWWFLVALLPLLAFPWFWVPRLWGQARRTGAGDSGLRLCAIWGLSALAAFSVISGKQLHYLVPELPAVALVTARLADGERLRFGLAALPVGLLAVAMLAAATGAIHPGHAFQALRPTAALLAAALVMIALIWSAIAMRSLAGGALLSLGLALTANLLIGLTNLREEYDSAGIAKAVAPNEAAGIAFTGKTYNAEFNFAGRLRRPVELPAAEALPAWAAAHPGGVIIGTENALAPAEPQDRILSYRNAPYVIRVVPDQPRTEIAP